VALSLVRRNTLDPSFRHCISFGLIAKSG